MDAFTQIVFSAIGKVKADKRALNAAELDAEARHEITVAFLKYVFYDTLLAYPMPDFAAQIIVEALERRVDWHWVANAFLTEEGLN
jgi:hypothetical protein